MELKMNITPPLSLQSLSTLQDDILLDRLEYILPSVMKECNVELWIVIGDEYNEGPVVRSLLPSSFFMQEEPLYSSLRKKMERIIAIL